MSCQIKSMIKNHTCKTGEELARACNKAILDFYPGLKVRWAKIYGNRWSYLFGNSGEVSLNSKKIRLNDEYGIYIDNSEILKLKELEELIAALKECFKGDTAY